MIAFEVFVNGQRICVAGTEIVTSVGVDWTQRTPDQVRFNVSGIHAGEQGEGHVEWPVPNIGVGDEIIIRVLSTDAIDPPTRRPHLPDPPLQDDQP